MKRESDLYKNIIAQFSKTKILVIGDLMVDRFVRGKVTRISPEAPVPVVLVKEETDIPGGAGNVVMNLASLGAQVNCCGLVGKDEVAENLLKTFHTLGIRTDGVKQDDSLATTLKTRVIAEHQQVVRFDRENRMNAPHALHTELENLLSSMIRESDGVILSDYGKGVITRSLLTHAIRAANHLKKPICVDPKLEHFQSYKNVTCITPNTQEALGGMRKVHLNHNTNIRDLGFEILKKLKCRSVLITQGEEGMTLFEKDSVTHIPAKSQEVYDVTGAGDTVIAVMTLAVACGASLAHAATLANLAAGIVIGKLGTATVSPQELKEALNRL
ncbi:MAG: D-glycero-beta-D-manno-heptose-7-phosphate kinase [Elusimicrobia bacterium]|nr:D-glycero-beta-D-manno-heptose-7-phosphate kinase [Elusimicrobiota bacterium]